jgi:hypothetical protein
MKHAAEAATPNPFDVRALFDMNKGMAAFGGDAMRTWLDGAAKMQAETTAFWTARVGKDVAAMTAFARCTTPAEAMELQTKYARDAMADYYAEGQRLMRFATDAAKQGMPATGSRSA